MQEDPKYGSYCRGTKVLIGDRVSRGVGKVKDKIESNKGTDLKGPSVTQSIMSLRRKDGKRGIGNVRRTEKSHIWGEPKRSTVFV